jgi:hypothetical protein
MIFPKKFTSHPNIPIKTKNAATMPVDDMKARIQVTIGARETSRRNTAARQLGGGQRSFFLL